MLIVADDLSGAAIAPSVLRTPGRRTVVALDAAQADAASGAAVIALDTDTRRLAPEQAARRAADAWQSLGGAERRLYKKIDSTLRGNWVAEVAALQPSAGVAIVAPAFPATGRTVRDGLVYVRGVAARRDRHMAPSNTRSAAPIFNRCSKRPDCVPRGSPSTCCAANRPRSPRRSSRCGRSGKQALIVDAETEADLNMLARVTVTLRDAFFWVGSGGLARELAALPELFDASAPARAETVRHDGPVLTLVGSLSACLGLFNARCCANAPACPS